MENFVSHLTTMPTIYLLESIKDTFHTRRF